MNSDKENIALISTDGMDSLHVSNTQGSSKTSSRSASPCRPRSSISENPHNPAALASVAAIRDSSQTHHSHGSSLDSTKSHDSVTGRSRQKSPTSRRRSPTQRQTQADMELFFSGSTPNPTTPNKGVEHTDDSVPNITSESIPDEEICYSSFLSNGSSEHVTYDEADANTSTKPAAALEHLNKKILRVRDSIRIEQIMRDENVNEYLKCAANADKQQLQRIKAVFEKKNQKSAHLISQMQKKLDNYTKKLRELEESPAGTSGHKPPREVLRDMGQGLKNVGGNIRDGITGFSGSVMSKPREFAHLIKNKFGSADNINHLSTWYVGGVAVPSGSDGSAGNGGGNGGGTGSDTGAATGSTEKVIHHGSATLPGMLHSGASQGSMGHAAASKFPSDEGSECSSVTSESIPGYHHHPRRQEMVGQGVFGLKEVFTELQFRREEYERLREKLDGYKNLQQEVQFLNSALQEERFRLERLEEQVNDLTELHQNEVENLKQALADMEEKVQYQSEERLRDIHEMLEHCQTKMQKMEHQALQQQQYVTLEGLDNSNARALVVKLINVVLTVLQVILLLVATVAGIIMPFLRTRVRFLSTIFIVIAMLFVLKQWPEVRDIGSHVIHHLKEMLDPVK